MFSGTFIYAPHLPVSSHLKDVSVHTDVKPCPHFAVGRDSVGSYYRSILSADRNEAVSGC
jgi:hypothetical protein